MTSYEIDREALARTSYDVHDGAERTRENQMDRSHSRHSWPADKSPPIERMHNVKRRQRDALAMREAMRDCGLAS